MSVHVGPGQNHRAALTPYANSREGGRTREILMSACSRLSRSTEAEAKAIADYRATSIPGRAHPDVRLDRVDSDYDLDQQVRHVENDPAARMDNVTRAIRPG